MGGLLLGLAHRGEFLLAVPAILCALALLKSEVPVWRLGIAFGCMESLCIADVWLIQPSAGFFALLEFAGYRGVAFGVLGALSRYKIVSPWVLGITWALLEAIHARIPIAVPNVLGEILVESPLSVLIAWLGSFGVSAWVVGSLTSIIQRHRDVLSVVLILGPLVGAVFGAVATEAEEPLADSQQISMIRGGVKMEAYGSQDVVQHYIDLSTMDNAPTDLVIWPETATGMVWNRDEDAMRAINRFGSSQALLMGATRLSETGRIVNGALYIDRSGVQVLDKYRQVWPIESTYAEGALSRDIDTVIGRIRVLICADALDPWSVMTTASRPYELLVVLADASRLVGSRLVEMHLRRTQVRALEAGTWALFVEQSATLAVVSPHGAVQQLDTKLHQSGELRAKLGVLSSATRLSYWLCVWAGMIGLACVDELLRRRQIKSTKMNEQPSERLS